MICVEDVVRDRFLALKTFRQLGDQSAWHNPTTR